jgi:hypothetical protein
MRNEFLYAYRPFFFINSRVLILLVTLHPRHFVAVLVLWTGTSATTKQKKSKTHVHLRAQTAITLHTWDIVSAIRSHKHVHSREGEKNFIWVGTHEENERPNLQDMNPHHHSFVLQCILRHVHSFVHSQISKECYLVIPVSISNIHCLPDEHAVAAYDRPSESWFPTFVLLTIK